MCGFPTKEELTALANECLTGCKNNPDGMKDIVLEVGLLLNDITKYAQYDKAVKDFLNAVKRVLTKQEDKTTC
jgi:hypothetical protein